MYATIRTYAGKSDLSDELRSNQESVRSQMSAVPGFKAYYFVDTPDGNASITVCNDQAGTEESTRVAAAWIAENLPNLSLAPPAVSSGEVVVSF
jgi:hypothetical protein